MFAFSIVHKRTGTTAARFEGEEAEVRAQVRAFKRTLRKARRSNPHNDKISDFTYVNEHKLRVLAQDAFAAALVAEAKQVVA